MDNPLIFQILGVVLVLFFCFLTYMNTRVWRATHVTFAFLVFAASIGFLVYAALTIKTHSIWKDRAQKLEIKIKEKEALADLAKNGVMSEIPQTTPNVRLVQQQIAREVVDRGRVWRGCTITGNDANGITLSTVPADTPQGTVPLPNHIAPKTTVHAFKEMLLPELGAKVPVAYLGQFGAVNPTDTTVTLSPILPLDAQQRQEIADPGSTWVLYETMPVDSHEVFSGMAEDQIRALMPIERTAFADQPAAYEQFIKDIARSGQDFEETDSPEDKWVLVKFNKPYTVQVDGNGAGVMITQRNAFDQTGGAILPRLQRGGEVEFEVGDEALFFSDDEAVRAMIADNTVTLVKNVFVRPLVDFETVMGNTFQRTEEIDTQMKQLTRDLAAIRASNAEITKQLTLKETEKTKVEEDLKYVKYELANLQGYTQTLQSQVRAVNNRLSEIYRTNKKLEENLYQINAALTEEIDQRTRAATASAGG